MKNQLLENTLVSLTKNKKNLYKKIFFAFRGLPGDFVMKSEAFVAASLQRFLDQGVADWWPHRIDQSAWLKHTPFTAWLVPMLARYVGGCFEINRVSRRNILIKNLTGPKMRQLLLSYIACNSAFSRSFIFTISEAMAEFSI